MIFTKFTLSSDLKEARLEYKKEGNLDPTYSAMEDIFFELGKHVNGSVYRFPGGLTLSLRQPFFSHFLLEVLKMYGLYHRRLGRIDLAPVFYILEACMPDSKSPKMAQVLLMLNNTNSVATAYVALLETLVKLIEGSSLDQPAAKARLWASISQPYDNSQNRQFPKVDSVLNLLSKALRLDGPTSAKLETVISAIKPISEQQASTPNEAPAPTLLSRFYQFFLS